MSASDWITNQVGLYGNVTSGTTPVGLLSHVVSIEPAQHIGPSRLGSAVGGIIAFLFIIFGIFGDTLIITAILTKRELRNNLLNIFIVSCQLNDIFNIGFNQFLVGLSYTFMHFPGPSIVCEFFVYTSIISTGSLLWHHVLISIHRYLIVVCNLNLRYLNLSPKSYVCISLILARLIPTIVCIPALSRRNMTVYSRAALRCMLAPGGVSSFQNLLIVLVNMLIPCLLIVFCFVSIFTRVHKVSKNIRHAIFTSTGTKSLNSDLAAQIINQYQNKSEANTSTNANSNLLTVTPSVNHASGRRLTDYSAPPSRQSVIAQSVIGGGGLSSTMISMHREIQISKMFAIILLVFLFGYWPYGIIRMMDKNNSLHPDVYVLLTVLFIMSISISPIIYGLMNKQIRVQCVILLRRIFKCERFGGDESHVHNKNLTSLSASRRSIYQNELIGHSDYVLATPSSGIMNERCNNNNNNIKSISNNLIAENKSLLGDERPQVKQQQQTNDADNKHAESTSSKKPVKNAKKASLFVAPVVLSSDKTKPIIIIDKLDDGGIYKGPP